MKGQREMKCAHNFAQGCFKLLMHSGSGIVGVSSIFTYFHLFVPIFIHFHASVWPLDLGSRTRFGVAP